MKYAVALIVMLGVSFIACDQGQVAGGVDFTELGKQFVEMLAKGDYTSAVAKFDDTMKGVMPEVELEDAWQSLLGKVGPFQKIVGVSQKKQEGYDIVRVTCAFEKAELDVKVVYNSQKQVSGLWFVPK